MSDIRAFRGLRFARDATPRLAPPYDVIADTERDCMAGEPESIVHLTLPPGPSGARDYAGVARLLARWIAEGVLVRDRERCLYAVEEHIEGGQVRRGVIALVRLHDYSERIILPHEQTMSGPKQDRLLLTRACKANLEPLFFLYEDRASVLPPIFAGAHAKAPLLRATSPDGVEIRVAAIAEPAQIEAVRAHLAPQPLVIADGHHRYETMVRYRDECRAAGETDRNAPHELVMAYCVDAFDPGSRVRAIHRVIEGETADPEQVLQDQGYALHVLASDAPAETTIEQLAQHTKGRTSFVVVLPGGRRVLATREQRGALDVQALHGELLPALGGEVSYDARPERVVAMLTERRAALGLLLNPLTADELFDTVKNGTVLPPKSTYFYPKLPAGLVVRDLT